MKQDGKIYFDGVEDDFFEDLALDLDEDPENVKVTVLFLVRQGLMELIDESEYLLKDAIKMTGSETSSASRVRKHRDKKALQCNTDVTQGNALPELCNGEKEIEIEKEIESEKDNNTICLEVESSKQEVFISLPLVTGSGFFDVTYSYLNSLRELYPAIDVEQEFKKMYAWLDSNPRNRKTARGIKRFITGWLSRAQDKAPVARGNTYGGGSNRNMSTNQYMEATAGWNE